MTSQAAAQAGAGDQLDWAASQPEVSIIAPFHNERESLGDLLVEIATALDGISMEVIAVDDGSDDGSGSLVAELAQTRPWLHLLRLGVNQGQTAALATGIVAARGRVIVTIDSDGQNDPRDIPRLLRELDETGADIVAGRRRRRQESLARRAVSSVANRLLRRLTGVPIHDTGCSLKAFRAEALQGMRLLRDDHRFLPAITAFGRARVHEIWVNDRPRNGGRSHYGYGRIPRVAVDLIGVWALRRFAGRPLRAAAWCASLLMVLFLTTSVLLALLHQVALAILATAAGLSVVLVVIFAAAALESVMRFPRR